MSTNTSHYNLTKPAGSENYDVSVQNGNMDKIDAEMWKLLQIRRTLTASDNLNSITENGTAVTGIYYIGSATPQNSPVADLAWCIMVQIVINATNMIHQYIYKPQAGYMWEREYSGNPSTWLSWKIVDNHWEQITGVNENVEVQLDTKYQEVYVEAAFSNGHILCFYVKAGARQDSGFYYNSTNNAGGAVSFTGGKKLTIYHPHFGGAQTTYSSIKVWGR